MEEQLLRRLDALEETSREHQRRIDALESEKEEQQRRIDAMEARIETLDGKKENSNPAASQ